MSKRQGFAAETVVAQSLINDNFNILERNYTIRGGEIDLIALKNDLIVFVEVKQRTNYYSDMSELITFSKQKKIINTAKQFLAKHDYSDKVLRFDVALLEGPLNNPVLTYISHAFSESDSL